MAEELAGTLVERVAIEAFVSARDDGGAEVGAWQDAGRSWAAIVPDGRGSSEGETRHARPRWRVTLRSKRPVGLTSRLLWRGAVLAVLAVETDPRRADRVTLRCETRFR